MSTVKIPSKRIIFAVRVAPSLWEAFDEAVRNTDDPTVMLVQAQAKTYDGNGGTSTSLSTQQKWDDHPGPVPSIEIKQSMHAALRDPEYAIEIINTAVGIHASSRALSGQLMIQHLSTYYGANNIRYNQPYDVDGRNDKFHETEFIAEDGSVQKSVEDVIPSGIYMPQLYHKLGANALSVMDPHSIYHRQNLINPFGKASVAILSNIKPMAEAAAAHYRDHLLNGTFRSGAPDGWDKKDDPESNAATERVREFNKHIWDIMPELHTKYGGSFESFHQHITFGITKVRRRAHRGAPAKPEIVGFHGDVTGCACLLIDDLVDSGSSMTKSGTVLHRHGAASVGTAVCHGPATREALYLLLEEKADINGEERVILDHHIFTNTVTRLEEFHAQLPAEYKNRVTMLNCGHTLLEEIAKPFPTGPVPFIKLGGGPLFKPQVG